MSSSEETEEDEETDQSQQGSESDTVASEYEDSRTRRDSSLPTKKVHIQKYQR